MYEVVEVEFDLIGKKDFFVVSKEDIKKGDKLIVEVGDSIDLGICVGNKKEISKDKLSKPINRVLRKATKEDFKNYNQNLEYSEKALKFAKKTAKELELNMSFVLAYYLFDRSQLFFYFTSDERVDFRELAKKLAQKYKTRIELRQIGVRDKSKLVGGIGPCGLFLCCNSFLTDFTSVSINMAKNQFLALNPTKINGVCGRLLCCLNYEDEVYHELKKGLPKIGSKVTNKGVTGKVVSIDIYNRTYKMELENNEIVEVSV